VLVERLIELLHGQANIPETQNNTEEPVLGFHLGLFLCDEPELQITPHRAFKLRAFEPYVVA
jgi:hypothetical protein